MKSRLPTIPEGLYPIRAVTRFTGLTADAIRVWERRYGAVKPVRTAGQARRYSADEVRRLLLLHEAVRRGHSIGDVARLPDADLRALLEQSSVLRRTRDTLAGSGDLEQDGVAAEGIVQEYLGAVSRFETRRSLEVLGTAATMMLPERFLSDVALPILDEVGTRWSRADMSVAQEHVASAQVRAFLSSLLRMAPAPVVGARRVLVGTPAGHRHEMGALMAAYVATVRGWDAVYVGPDLPLEELALAVGMARADLVMLSLICDVPPRERKALVDGLARLASRVPVWVGAPQGHFIHTADIDARRFTRLEELGPALDAFRSKRGA
jgi:methanogenic corrinoid protein MtbC1